MTISINGFHLGAVLLCHVLYVMLGALWYSPLVFGKAWMAEIGIHPDEKDAKESIKAMLLSNIPIFLQLCTLELLVVLTGSLTWLDGLIVGSIIGFGILGFQVIINAIYEKKSFRYELISIGYPLLGFIFSAIIMSIWR